MNAQQEAERLRKEFGDKAVKVVEFAMDLVCERDKPVLKYWAGVKSELQKPKSADPYIDEVPELSRLVPKIRDMMERLNPELSYNHIKMSHLPQPEVFAKLRGVGTMSRNRYKEAYEKYRTK